MILVNYINAQSCSELFFSEYVEGPGNNNAVEIYNPTSSSIDLSGYTINRYSNGASSGPEVWQLSGSIDAGNVIVVGNGQMDSVWVSTYWSLPVDAAFYSALDIHCNGDYDANSTFYFNGDDAMTLEKDGNILDIIGKVGEDPGAAWTDDPSAGYTDANGGTWWTKRQTLIRKSTIEEGVTQIPILFNPTLEWDSLPDATYSELGQHSCNCHSTYIQNKENISYVIFPNPASIAETININTKESIENIDIYNVLGLKIMTITDNKIPTEGMSSGTYIVKIYLENGMFFKDKLLIK